MACNIRNNRASYRPTNISSGAYQDLNARPFPALRLRYTPIRSGYGRYIRPCSSRILFRAASSIADLSSPDTGSCSSSHPNIPAGNRSSLRPAPLHFPAFTAFPLVKSKSVIQKRHPSVSLIFVPAPQAFNPSDDPLHCASFPYRTLPDTPLLIRSSRRREQIDECRGKDCRHQSYISQNFEQ